MFKLKKQLFPTSIRSLLANPKEAIKELSKDPELAGVFLEYFIDKPDELAHNIPLILQYIQRNPETLLHYKQGGKFFELLKENDLLHLRFPAICALANASILFQAKKTKREKPALSYIPQEIRKKENPLCDAFLGWIDLEKKDAMERTPIHLAANSGHLPLLSYLLEKDPRKNKILLSAQDIEKKSALHFAATSKQFPIVEYLIEKGSNIDAKDQENKTPLHYASGSGNAKVVRFLIEKGANPKSKDIKGKIPLICAIEHSQEEVAKYLSTLTNLNQKDHSGKLSLHYACQNENLALIKFLISKTQKINALDNSGKAPIHYLALHGFAAAIETFINHGADINLPDSERRAPLHIACKHMQFAFCESLLRKKANIEVRDIKKKTPLFYAVEFYMPQLTTLFLKKRANVDALDTCGRSLLHYAVISSHKSQVKILTDYHCKMNVQDQKGLTPLHFAAATGDEKIVKMLLENGADVWVRDEMGKTPAHLACAINSLELVEMLITEEMTHLTDSAKNSMLHVVLMNEPPSLKIIHLLIKRKVNPDAKDQNGNTALHKAIPTFDPEIIGAIAEKTQIIDSQDQKGQTPLHLICALAKVDETKILEILLKQKADPNLKNKQGKTPTQLLDKHLINMKSILKKASVQFHGNNVLLDAVKLKDQEKLKALLRAKADPNVLNSKQETPLYWAVQFENAVMVKELIEHGANPILGKNPPFFLALEKQSLPLIQNIVKAKTSWENLKEIKKPLLQPLIQQKKSDILALILPVLKKKCPEILEKKGANQKTMLHLAISKKLPVSIIKQLKSPSILQNKDANGLTPLQLAIKIKYQSAIKVLS